MDSDFNFLLFISFLFVHLFRYRLLTRFVCHTNTHRTRFGKQSKIGVNFSEFENYWIYQVLRICMHWFFLFSILLCLPLTLSHSLARVHFCWLNAHIVHKQTLILPTFEYECFRPRKKRNICAFRSALSLAHFYFFFYRKIWNSVQSVVECVKFNEPLNEWDWNGQIYSGARETDKQTMKLSEWAQKQCMCVCERVRKIS